MLNVCETFNMLQTSMYKGFEACHVKWLNLFPTKKHSRLKHGDFSLQGFYLSFKRILKLNAHQYQVLSADVWQKTLRFDDVHS